MKRIALVALLALSGCQALVSFDRDQIVDGGQDASMDAAVDVSTDVSEDAMPDASMDAEVDAEMDASMDADLDAMPDAEMDASMDAMPDAEMDASMDAEMDTMPDAPECSMPSECDDGVACTTNECTENACVYTPDDAACDDTIACTVDSCDAVMGCSNEPSDALCDDENPCTANTCGATGCEATDLCSFTTVELSDLTSIVSVTATTTASGFIAIVDAGSMILGNAPIAVGTATVEVELNRPLASGETISAVLYLDEGIVGTFESDVDPIALDSGDEGITSEATLTFDEAVVPDAQWTLTGDGANYTFNARPSTLGLAEGEDPTIQLESGWRYRIVSPDSHPFEFFDDATGGPIVRLSETLDPAFESTVSIAWSEGAMGSDFTVSADFFPAVNAYRCSAHPTTMQGVVEQAP